MPRPGSCTLACTLPKCGDSFIQGSNGEVCDDGTGSNNDFCPTNCKINVCGDGFQWTGVEACDDGNVVSGDGCNNNCRTLVCGSLTITP